jgi:lipoprotein-anchoring transpeptidase ErfK/SrfK
MSDGVDSGIPGHGDEPNEAEPQPQPLPAAEPQSVPVPSEPEQQPGLIARLPRRGVIAAGGLLVVGAIGGIVAGVAGSGNGAKNNAANGGSGNNAPGSGAHSSSSPSASPSPTAPAPTFTTVPANGASNVDPSKPVTVTVADGTITSVQLSGGQETSGTLSGDKSTWTSNGALAVDTSYQLQIQAADQNGASVNKTVSFSTLKPTATLGVLEMWPGDGVSVGVGQPIRVQFTNYVPQSYRAAVEKACVVTTTPAVAGAWHWVTTDTMDWRPQQFWQTGTQISVALNLAGVRAGDHQFFVHSHTLKFDVRDTDLRLIIDAKAYKATAYENGKVVRTFPIDTGENDPRFITWSGVFAVLGKGNPVEMKGDYGNGDKYDELVNWATQITYSGTYVHAAPWDGQIGEVNSSHGCIHCNTVDATWFYNLAQVGDVVQITGTSKTVDVTNGFGDFTGSWSSWLSGSAYGATLGGAPVSA